MALNDRFAEYHAQAATANCSVQKSLIENHDSSINRKLVQELANRPSVVESLREERNIPSRFERNQERFNGTIKSRLGFRNERCYLSVHDRLGYVRNRPIFHRRHSKSGISPLIRDRLGFQEPDEMNRQNHRDNFEETRQSSSDDIYVEVNINESEPKIDLNDVHFKIKCRQNQPRAYPTGIFNYYDGIRYNGSEIFIWLSESDPIHQF